MADPVADPSVDRVNEFLRQNAPGYIAIKDRRFHFSPPIEVQSAPDSININVAKVVDAEDQTVYVKRSEIDTWLLTPENGQSTSTSRVKDALDRDFSFEEHITLTDGKCECRGRALICLCAKGTWVSITLRRSGKLTKLGGSKIADRSPLLKARKLGISVPTKTGYTNNGFSEDESHKYFNPISEIYTALYDRVLKGEQSPQGLIVVAGSTGTGKSQVARGIIDLYIRNELNKYRNSEGVDHRDSPANFKRRLHLVTYEDPIETFAFATARKDFYDPDEAGRCGVDYTPRQKDRDVRSLADAFQDAKRQTPTLFYIGEVRHDSEWAEIINFAGAGNLVVATTHANSVVEAMKKVFQALQVKTPADRGQIASRLLGVIHLRPHLVSGDYNPRHETAGKETAVGITVQPFSWQVTLPALWRKTPQGVKSLVSDGLSSVLPYYLPKDDKSQNCIGRRSFARIFLDSVESHHPDADWASQHSSRNGGETLLGQLEDDLLKAAIGFDLEEM